MDSLSLVTSDKKPGRLALIFKDINQTYLYILLNELS